MNFCKKRLRRVGEEQRGKNNGGEERGQVPSTEPVPVLPALCESDVDVGISQVISMFGNRSVVQKKFLRGWPIGQSVASRLASPMSFNDWGLGIYGQDWPGWPTVSRSDPVGRGGYAKASSANCRARQQFPDDVFSQNSLSSTCVLPEVASAPELALRLPPEPFLTNR